MVCLTRANCDSIPIAESAPSLFSLIEGWLERTPFLDVGSFSWWAHYRTAVESMLAGDRSRVAQQQSEVRLHRVPLYAGDGAHAPATRGTPILTPLPRPGFIQSRSM